MELSDNTNFTNETNNQNNNHNSRTNYENITELHRRLFRLTQDTMRDDLIEIEETIYRFLMSNQVFIYSPILIIFLLFFLHQKLEHIAAKPDFSYKSLETEIMWIPYMCIFILIITLLWNIYLLSLKLVIGFCVSKDFESQLKMKFLLENSTSEVLYFNPFYFNIIIYHLNTKYISTNFDLFFIMIVAIHYAINFIFTLYIYNFFKIKIANISNVMESDNRKLLIKMRILFLLLISMNFFSSYTLSYLINELEFSFNYLVHHKSFYLIIKQLSMWYENEVSYKQLDSYYATNEKYYINCQFYITILKLNNIGTLIQILTFGNMLFIKRGSYMFFGFCSVICVHTVFELYKIFYNYVLMKRFFDKMETVFPIENIPDKNLECIICTESLTVARKLSCNHYFHLICLSKWIEKGKKSCPLCRRDFDEHLDRTITRDFDHSMRLGTTSLIFEWFCNLTIFTNLRENRGIRN